MTSGSDRPAGALRFAPACLGPAGRQQPGSGTEDPMRTSRRVH